MMDLPSGFDQQWQALGLHQPVSCKENSSIEDGLFAESQRSSSLMRLLLVLQISMLPRRIDLPEFRTHELIHFESKRSA